MASARKPRCHWTAAVCNVHTTSSASLAAGRGKTDDRRVVMARSLGLLEPGPRRTGPRRTGPRRTGPRRTGPLDTGPAETGPLDTGPLETRPPGRSGVARRMVLSVRLDAYFALLGSIRRPHHPLVLHHLDDLRRPVVADSELALKPRRGTSLRLRNDADGLIEARIQRLL